MNGTLRTLKLTIGSLAILIAMTLAVVPTPFSGLGIQRASAMVSTSDFYSKEYFKNWCKAVGGTFSEGDYSTACVLEDGSIYLCDETAKNCVILAKADLLKVGIKLELVNGTLTAVETGGSGTTTTGVSRTTNSTILKTKDR